ncbi:MAG: tetratricopeptide repeat protein, partial [Pseudomonadales bacterium]
MLPIKNLLLPMCLLWLLAGCASTSDAEQELQSQAESEEVVGKAQKKMTDNGDRAARSRDYEAAVAFYREALRLKETAPLWLRVGFAYQGMEEARKAAGAFQKALALDAEDPRGWQALGKLYLNNRQLDLARKHYQHALM